MSGTIHLLTNRSKPHSGGAAVIDGVIAEFQARGKEVLELSAESADEAELAAIQLVDEGVERLVAVGGDGMVHIAIQAVAETESILGIVPFGTGNDFARALGMPTGRHEAVTAALQPPTPIDLMHIGNRWAASVATVGFSAAVNARANSMRWPKGASRYTLATLLELPRLKALTYELTVDNQSHTIRATLITVANTSDFGGGMRITPTADATDGTLNITVVGDAGRVELVRWFRNVFDGSHLHHAKVSTLSGRCVTITNPGVRVWADGESITDSPVTIEAVPGALQLAGL